MNKTAFSTKEEYYEDLYQRYQKKGGTLPKKRFLELKKKGLKVHKILEYFDEE